MKDFKFFACRDSIRLGRKVARLLGKKPGKLHLSDFADGENKPWVEEKVKGKNCVVLQTTRINPNNRLMELCLVVSALKTAGAKRVLAVIPSFGYARQYRAFQEGETSAAGLMARFLEAAGVDKAVFVDLHSEKVLGLFKILTANLRTTDLFVDQIKKLRLKNLIIVAPDKGYVGNASKIAKKLNVSHVWIEKRREIDGSGKEDWSEAVAISGKVEGVDAVIVDDEISTGGTIAKGARLLKRNGARKIYVFVTHPVFSEKTYKNLSKAPLEKIVVTDTIPLEEKAFKKLSNLRVISVASLLAEEIKKQI